jgi:signal transduction histidine kinase
VTDNKTHPLFLKRKGIRPRLLTYFSLALLLPTLATAAIVFVTIRGSLLKANFREERELSRRIADKIGAHVESARRGLSLLAIDQRDRRLSPQNQLSSLRRFLARSPDILEVTAYDAQGHGIVRAARVNGKLVWGKSLHARAGRKELAESLAGRRFMGPVYLSTGDKSPQMILATPSGTGRGALVARLNLKNMGTLVSESASATITPFVVDEEGRLLAHPDPALVLSAKGLDRPTVRVFLDDKSDNEGYAIDQGKGAQRTLAVFHRVPGVPWAAFVESAYGDVLAPIRRMGTRVLGIAMGLGILFWVVGLSMVNKILRPLDDLEEGLQRIGRGDLSQRIEIKTGDELERVAETVNRMAVSLAATDRTKRDLTHMIVHDLKNPLSATLGSIECVLHMHQDTLGPDTRKMLTLGAKSGRELLRLIQNLLDMAKMEEGQLKIHPEYFSLLELAGQCVDDLEIQIAKENKVISVEVDNHLPKAWADRDLVHRVLANLLTNALKHTPPKTEISIHVRLDQKAKAFVVSVQDTGEGVPSDFKERIFEKFSQAEAKRRNTRVGSGLGLTFCKLAVEAHGGKIWVDSEPGMGSEFFFTLPLPVSAEIPRPDQNPKETDALVS